MPRALVNFISLNVICITFAYAATIAGVPADSIEDTLIKYAWVLLISVIAWSASSLPVLADWPGAAGRTKLLILQSLLKAVFAGIGAFVGSVLMAQNIMASYLAAASAAFACDAYYRNKQAPPPPEHDKPDPAASAK